MSPQRGSRLAAQAAVPAECVDVRLIGQQSYRRSRGLRPEHMLTIATQLPDTVDTVRIVGRRREQIREHGPGAYVQGPL